MYLSFRLIATDFIFWKDFKRGCSWDLKDIYIYIILRAIIQLFVPLFTTPKARNHFVDILKKMPVWKKIPIPQRRLMSLTRF